MVLSYDGYNEAIGEQRKVMEEIEKLKMQNAMSAAHTAFSLRLLIAVLKEKGIDGERMAKQLENVIANVEKK